MGLNFGTLVNAALGGSAAYMGGRREAQARAKKAADEEEEKLSRLAENSAQAEAARELAADRKWKREHPEAAAEEKRPQQWEAERDYFDSLVQNGTPVTEARKQANIRFGHNEPREQGPVYGSPEYLKAVDRVEGVRDRHQGGRTGGRDTGEAGSAKEAIDRREFMQKRIAHYIDNRGMSGAEAQAAAEREYRGAQYSANAVSKPASTTAKALARTAGAPPGYMEEPGRPGVYRPKSSSSSNAGTRGVKPTETSSTQKSNPLNANSPKVGASREATDADIRRAILAVGKDEKKIEKWLFDHGLEP